MASSRNAGWHPVTTSRRAHYFGEATRSLCAEHDADGIEDAPARPPSGKCPACRHTLEALEREARLFA